MLEVREFFRHLEGFRFKALFEGVKYPWEAVGRIGDFVHHYLLGLPKNLCQDVSFFRGVASQQIRMPAGHGIEKLLVVQSCIQESQDIYLEELDIYLGRNTVIEPGVVIKSPALIGEGSQVRQGAYLRGNVIIGDHCVVGHTTEVKNSVFLNGAEAGHFAYVGDSILGNHVNLGAGTKLANLLFRTVEEKEGGELKPISIPVGGHALSTGLVKLGALLGDYVELGCNVVTSPGTLIGYNSWVYPNTTVKKGYYPPGVILRPKEREVEALPMRLPTS